MAKEITLSDGKIAIVKDGKGLDLLNAQKKAKTTLFREEKATHFKSSSSHRPKSSNHLCGYNLWERA